MGFLSEAGVSALWSKVRANFGRSLEISGGTTIKLMNGAGTPGKISEATIPNATTSVAGAMSAADKEKLDGIASGANKYTHPSTLSSALTSTKMYKVAVDKQGHITDAVTVSKSDITGLGIPAQDTTYDAATTSAAGLMSAADKGKLDGIAAGANAYTHPSYTAKSAGLYKVTVDATGHVSAATAAAKSDITALGIPAQDTTYSAATTSAAGLMSAADKTKLDGVAEGANNYTHPSYTPYSTSNLYKIKVDTKGHVSSATAVKLADITGLGIPSTSAMNSAIDAAIAAAQTGAAMYKGSITSNDTISGSDYKAGWYWVVGAAGTYVGESCEAGDMIFANSNKGGTYSASHFDVIQNNIVEMTAAEVEAVCTL